GQFDRIAAGGIDDQAPDVLDRGALRFAHPHQHVDLADAKAVAGGDVAAHLVDHRVGDLARGQAQGRGAFLVEYYLYLGIALLDGRLDVAIVRVVAQHAGKAGAGDADRRQVAALDLDLERRRQREQLRAGEVHLGGGMRLHGRAQ